MWCAQTHLVPEADGGLLTPICEAEGKDATEVVALGFTDVLEGAVVLVAIAEVAGGGPDSWMMFNR